MRHSSSLSSKETLDPLFCLGLVTYEVESNRCNDLSSMSIQGGKTVFQRWCLPISVIYITL